VAEVAVSRQMFAEILSLITGMQAQAAPAWTGKWTNTTNEDARGTP